MLTRGSWLFTRRWHLLRCLGRRLLVRLRQINARMRDLGGRWRFLGLTRPWSRFCRQRPLDIIVVIHVIWIIDRSLFFSCLCFGHGQFQVLQAVQVVEQSGALLFKQGTKPTHRWCRQCIVIGADQVAFTMR